MSFVSSEYPQIDDYILNDLRIEPEDYDSFDDFLNVIKKEFDKQISSAVLESASFIWDSRIEEEEIIPPDVLEPPEPPKEVKLTENQKNDIKNNDQNEDLTKREKTIETLKIANQEITVKQFYELNPNMLKPTARRELSTAVKRGELERVRKGVYRKL